MSDAMTGENDLKLVSVVQVGCRRNGRTRVGGFR